MEAIREKKKQIYRKLMQCAVCMLLLVGSDLSAVSAQEILVSPNRGTADDDLVAAASVKVKTFFQADRSYSCVVIVREYDQAVPKQYPAFVSSIVAPDSSTISGSLLGSMKPGIAVPANLLMKQAGLRLSLIAPQTGRYELSLEDAQGSGTGVPGTTIRCNDTTLYGGFNRFFADIAIVELSNDTSSDITAFITIIDFDGVVVKDKQQLFVGAGKRADAVFADLPAMRFGQILVTYEGSLGALTGYVSEYDFGSTPGSLILKRERPMTQTEALP